MKINPILERLTSELAKLPGIGRRSAERLAFHLLYEEEKEAMQLALAIRDVKKKLRRCSTCFNMDERDPCGICADSERDHATICVVETIRDLIALEETDEFNGVYHVLMGHIAPLEQKGPEDLSIDALLARVRKGGVREVILGTNPDFEGDTTAAHIGKLLEGEPVKVSQLGRGLPSGGRVEYMSKSILSDAIRGRRPARG